MLKETYQNIDIIVKTKYSNRYLIKPSLFRAKLILMSGCILYPMIISEFKNDGGTLQI